MKMILLNEKENFLIFIENSKKFTSLNITHRVDKKWIKWEKRNKSKGQTLNKTKKFKIKGNFKTPISNFVICDLRERKFTIQSLKPY